MAYLMSDMAAGSDAALRMQQNMAAAPYVQENAALAAEENRIKVQQEQANLEKSKLATLISETGFKAGEESKARIQKVLQSPEAQEAVKNKDYIALTKIMNPEILSSGDTKSFVDNVANIELAEQRKARADQLKADVQASELARAKDYLKSVPEEKLGEVIQNLPENATKAAIASIGQANWDRATPQEKRTAMLGTMDTAAQRTAITRAEGAIKKQEKTNEGIKTVQELRNNKEAHRKTVGAGGSSAVSKLEANVEKVYTEQEKSADSYYRPRVDKITGELTKLTQQANIERLEKASGGQPRADTTASINELTKELEKLNRERNDRLIKIVERLPESEYKKRLMHQHNLIGAAHAEAPAPKKEEPKGKDATSNKPLSESEFNSKWKAAKPGDKLVGPDGKTYTKK